MIASTLQTVILEVIADNDIQARTWIGPRQDLTIGSNDMAEFAVRHDPELAPIHFRLSSNDLSCRIYSNPDAATFVNGEAVSTAVLQDGDLISCGRTQFVARVQGGMNRAQAAVEESNSAIQQSEASPAEMPAETNVPRPSAQTSNGGMASAMIDDVMSQLGLA